MHGLSRRETLGVSFTECFILFVFVAILKYIVMNMAKLQVCTSKDLRFTLSKHSYSNMLARIRCHVKVKVHCRHS